MEEAKVKDDKWLYMPCDLLDFLKVLKKGQPGKVFYCLHLIMNKRPLPKDLEPEVLLTVMHVLSFHKNRKEQDEEEEICNEENT